MAHKGPLTFEDLLWVVGCKKAQRQELNLGIHTHRGTKKPKPKQTQLVSDIIVHKQTLTAQDPHVEPGVDVGQLILENKLKQNYI